MFAYFVSAFVLVSMVTCEERGTNHDFDSDNYWAYQWYTDEPFLMTCKLNVTSGTTIQWETPGKKILSTGYMDDEFEVQNGSDVYNLKLYIKKVTAGNSGVYACFFHSVDSSKVKSRMIIGLNIHEERYKKKFDKYRHNFIVAVIATAVFVVPLGTSCFVYQYQYQSPEQKARKQKRKAGHQYATNGGDIPMKSTERIVDGGEEKSGKDGYENPNFSTQM